MKARIGRLYCAVCRTGFDSEGLEAFLAHDCTDHAEDRASFEARFAVGLALLCLVAVLAVVLWGGVL